MVFQIGTARTDLCGKALDNVIGPATWGLCERLAASLGGEVTRHGEGESGFNGWGGKAENEAAAQAALMERAKANGAATLGNYV